MKRGSKEFKSSNDKSEEVVLKETCKKPSKENDNNKVSNIGIKGKYDTLKKTNNTNKELNKSKVDNQNKNIATDKNTVNDKNIKTKRNKTKVRIESKKDNKVKKNINEKITKEESGVNKKEVEEPEGKRIKETITLLKILRTNNHLTQKYIANKLYLSVSAYNRKENGKRALTITEIFTIADIFGLDQFRFLERVSKEYRCISS